MSCNCVLKVYMNKHYLSLLVLNGFIKWLQCLIPLISWLAAIREVEPIAKFLPAAT